MSTSLINLILLSLVIAYFFAATLFMRSQKQGESFIPSFDKALIRGGCLFLLCSGLASAVSMYGSVPVLNYA